MAPIDRQMLFWLVLLAIGIGGYVLAFLGEFVLGWWRDLGARAAWTTIGISVVAAPGAGGRFQLHGMASDVRDIQRHAALHPRILANTEAIEAPRPRDRAPPPADPRRPARRPLTPAHAPRSKNSYRPCALPRPGCGKPTYGYENRGPIGCSLREAAR